MCVGRHVTARSLACEQIFSASDGRELLTCQGGGGVYMLGKRLEKALFGAVYLAHVCERDAAGSYCATEEQVAVKVLELERVRTRIALQDNVPVLEDTPKEIEVLEVLSAPPPCEHMVRLVDVGASADRIHGHVYIVLEYAGASDLYYELVRESRFPEARALKMARQVLTAVVHMHGRGYAHLDLSLENVMLDEEGNAKIIDCGVVERLRPATLDEDVRAAFARSPPHARDKLPGKKPYYAPEVRSRAGPRCASASSRPRSVQLLSGEPYYADRVDVWCVGIMLCSMLTGSYPWEGGWRVGLPYYQTIVPVGGNFSSPAAAVGCGSHGRYCQFDHAHAGAGLFGAAHGGSASGGAECSSARLTSTARACACVCKRGGAVWARPEWRCGNSGPRVHVRGGRHRHHYSCAPAVMIQFMRTDTTCAACSF